LRKNDQRRTETAYIKFKTCCWNKREETEKNMKKGEANRNPETQLTEKLPVKFETCTQTATGRGF
jgi:hypothetical protein